VYTTEHHARLVEFALPRLLCPVARSPFADATYCPRDRGIVSARTFSYGWAVHRIPAAHDESVWRAAARVLKFLESVQSSPW